MGLAWKFLARSAEFCPESLISSIYFIGARGQGPRAGESAFTQGEERRPMKFAEFVEQNQQGWPGWLLAAVLALTMLVFLF